METHIFLTRHGETVWNREKKFQGWQNSPLTEKGMEQGKNLNLLIEKLGIEVIYTSPLDRARITALNARGNLDIPLRELEDLKEIGLGIWEGKSYDELVQSQSDDIKAYLEEAMGYCPPGGETREDLVNRSFRAKDRILGEAKGKKVLIVTHGMTLMTLIHAFSGEDLEKIINEDVMPQTSITHIVIEEGREAKMLLKGDTSHFKEGW